MPQGIWSAWCFVFPCKTHKKIMKDWLKKNWFKIVLVLVALFAFYWYSLMPYLVKKHCHNNALQVSRAGDGRYNKSNYDAAYYFCLDQNGI